MEKEQRDVCERYGVDFAPPNDTDKIGISESALRGEHPIHGLRHRPEGGTTGWFIWAGEWSDDPDFFKPLHLYHLTADCPSVVPLLALPPGWRFMLAPNHEDVWSDSALLSV